MYSTIKPIIQFQFSDFANPIEIKLQSYVINHLRVVMATIQRLVTSLLLSYFYLSRFIE